MGVSGGIVSGGKPIYGAQLGILMLDAQFPRIPGDMGHAGTWPFPVQYRIVRDATPEKVVRQGAQGLLPAFVKAARDLVADGADGITTNCGFLSLFQEELQEAVSVPVLTSSLCQVRMVNATLPKGKVAGVLTISASTLTDAHLTGAGVPDGTPIGTTEGGQEFTEAILGNALSLNVEVSREDNIQAAEAMVAAHPNIGAIVLECTNMGPYAFDIAAVTGLPVYSMISLAEWFHAGLAPRRFDPVPSGKLR